MKIIAMFNHKGGVSKTTTAYNLGWALADKGYRTILVDADPQCNLTGVAMNLSFLPERVGSDAEMGGVPEEIGAAEDAAYEALGENVSNFWAETAEENIYSALKPAFFSEPRLLEGVNCLPVKNNENLFLLPGSLNLGEFETDLAVAQGLSDSLQSSRNLPGAMYAMLSKTAEKMDADYMIIDMSPSLGAINQNLVSVSDLVIIPTSPDYYSIMALQSLSVKLNDWVRWAQQMANKESLKNATYPFPAPRLKLGGVVVQRYKLYRRMTAKNPYGTPSSSFAKWIRQLEDFVNNDFVPALDGALKFEDRVYGAADLEKSKVLAKIPDFNSLLPKSQEAGVPVFRLEPEHLDRQGIVLEQTLEQRDSLAVIFEMMAKRVLELTK